MQHAYAGPYRWPEKETTCMLNMLCSTHQGVYIRCSLEAARAFVHAQRGVGPHMHVPIPCISFITHASGNQVVSYCC